MKLERYGQIQNEIKRCDQEIESIIAALTSSKVNLTGMPRSTPQNPDDKLVELLQKKQEQEERLCDLHEESILARIELEKAISTLNTRERVILRYKYIHNMSSEDIAKDMNCSRETVDLIHRTALKKI